MKSLQRGVDLPQLLFSLMFILLMIIACLWVVQPFILGFAWASMVVIATWPLMIRLQHLLWGRRSLAVIAMTILLLLLFIIPIALLVSSLIDNSAPVIAWATQRHLLMPELAWLREIPFAGNKLYVSYHKLVDGGGSAIMRQVQPYIGRTTGFFVAQAGHFGRFMLHLALMLLFSVLLYWRGEQVGQGIRHFAYRMGGGRGDAAVLLAGQAIRCAGCRGHGAGSGGIRWYRTGDIGHTLCHAADGADDPHLPGTAGATDCPDTGNYLALLEW